MNDISRLKKISLTSYKFIWFYFATRIDVKDALKTITVMTDVISIDPPVTVAVETLNGVIELGAAANINAIFSTEYCSSYCVEYCNCTVVVL